MQEPKGDQEWCRNRKLRQGITVEFDIAFDADEVIAAQQLQPGDEIIRRSDLERIEQAACEAAKTAFERHVGTRCVVTSGEARKSGSGQERVGGCRWCRGTGRDPLSGVTNWLPCMQCGGSGREKTPAAATAEASD